MWVLPSDGKSKLLVQSKVKNQHAFVVYELSIIYSRTAQLAVERRRRRDKSIKTEVTLPEDRSANSSYSELSGTSMVNSPVAPDSHIISMNKELRKAGSINITGPKIVNRSIDIKAPTNCQCLNLRK